MDNDDYYGISKDAPLLGEGVEVIVLVRSIDKGEFFAYQRCSGITTEAAMYREDPISSLTLNRAPVVDEDDIVSRVTSTGRGRYSYGTPPEGTFERVRQEVHHS